MGPHQRHDASKKEKLLAAVASAQRWTDQPLAPILHALGLAPATYHRGTERSTTDRLVDLTPPGRPLWLPTPAEVDAVRTGRRLQPAMGYKRLAWWMVDQDIVYLRAHQVYSILKDDGLLQRPQGPSVGALRRPPPAERPDEQWHIDLMYVWIAPVWYYLVHILDAHSRYLVHWTLNATIKADTVTLTVQEALDGLPSRRRGEPRIVRDNGSQFLSAEWRHLVRATGVTDIPIRVAHPESNGLVERVHRTHREEALDGQLENYHHVLGVLTQHVRFYNEDRPHGALHYLCPVDYYRGDPLARLASRERTLEAASEERLRYWTRQAPAEQ